MKDLDIKGRTAEGGWDVDVRYMNDIKGYEVLTADEERELGRRIQRGEREALDRLVQCNLRFVVCVARCYVVRGMEMMDVVMEGNIGLIEAARQFDPDRGCRFTTYAVYWVKKAILEAIARDSRVVRLPDKKNDMLLKLNRFAEEFEQLYERRPTTEEMAEAVGVELHMVHEVLEASAETASLSQYSDKESEVTPQLDVVADEGYAPDEHLRQEDMRQEVRRLLQRLPRHVRHLIVRLYGLDGQVPATYEELSRELGLSCERVRQVKDQALRWMKD